MKKLFCTVLVAFSVVAPSAAQVLDETYRDLFDLYVMEQYEKCLKKALKYTEGEEAKKNPTSFVYVSMCYLQAFKHKAKFKEEINDPMKLSLTFADKFRKKDKDSSHFAKNREYMMELRRTVLKETNEFYLKKDYKKAAGYTKMLVKIFPGDPVVLLHAGLYNLLMKNTGEGTTFSDNAINSLKDGLKKSGNPDEDKENEKLFADAIIQYTNFLFSNNEAAKARHTITLAKDAMKDNQAIQEQYKRMIN